MHKRTWLGDVIIKIILMLSIVPVIAVILSGWTPGNQPEPPAPIQAQSGDPVLVGAGDISYCDQTKDEETANLLDGIAGTVFTLGDNAYPDGTQSQFNDCYEPSWGRHKSRTRPAAGNHDYHITGASGYYAYFGSQASPLDNKCSKNCKGYYSYDLGEWHIIVLNSEIAHEAGSAQEQWLRADLAANETACTLAYWHKPRFSSGKHGNSPDMDAFWQALYEFGADVVLNGHDHTYERFGPQNPNGQADPSRGIRQFIVGTGGASLYSFPAVQPNSQVRNNNTWGVLKLTLHSDSYDWRFIPIAGQTFTDVGNSNCVQGKPRQKASQTSEEPGSSLPPIKSEDLITTDHFESASLAVWSDVNDDVDDLSLSPEAALEGKQGLRVVVDDDNSLYLSDNRPEGEAHYQLRFSFDPNSITMANGDSHYIFYGYSIASKPMPVVRVSFRFNKGKYQLNAAARDDNTEWIKTDWFAISDDQHVIELAWHAATNAEISNGRLTFWIDSVQRASLKGIDNDTWRIDRARLGAVSGIDSGTRGTYYFDGFESTRRISDYPRIKRPGKSSNAGVS